MESVTRAGLVAGKTAFVTGAAKGLGRAIVNQLADAGASGAMFDVLPVEEAGNLPAGWTYRKGDVSCESDVEFALQTMLERHDRLDVVVANAGVTAPWRSTQDIDLEEWRRTFAVNVEGVAMTIKLAARQMMQAGGSIVALGSLNSW
ncbi:MAG: SDR family NAD(P)-dependent oxidoreductase, partial [Aestuariivirgaceae bacterium]